MIRRPPNSPLFPYPPLFRSGSRYAPLPSCAGRARPPAARAPHPPSRREPGQPIGIPGTSVSSITLLRVVGRRSEEHTSELQSPCNLVCRLLLEKKKHQ